MGCPMTSSELSPAQRKVLTAAAECVTTNFVEWPEIEAAECLVECGLLWRPAGKRARSYTYGITKKGRAALSHGSAA